MGNDAVVEGPYRCLICRWGAQLDDAIAITRRGICICLSCYLHETGYKPMPAWLRRDVTEAAGAA